jgi:hypothetical protein
LGHRSSAGWNPAARQEGFGTALGLSNPSAALASLLNNNGAATKTWAANLKEIFGFSILDRKYPVCVAPPAGSKSRPYGSGGLIHSSSMSPREGTQLAFV